VSLSIRPVVGEDRSITIDVLPSVSTQPQNTGSTTGVQFTYDTKFLETTARLREGEGLVVGGLIQRSKNRTTNKVPILGDIPLLGWFFKNEVETDEDHELAFAIFPRVVRPRDALLAQVDLPPMKAAIRGGAFVEASGGLGIMRTSKEPAGAGPDTRRVEMPPLEKGGPRER
jgi:Flp pilus assembly secretin CpaC